MRCSGQVEWLRDGGASLLQVGGNLALDFGGGGQSGDESAAAWLQILVALEPLGINITIHAFKS